VYLISTYQYFVGFHWVHPQSKASSWWGVFTLKMEQLLAYINKFFWKFLQFQSVESLSSARCYWDSGLCVSHEDKIPQNFRALDLSPSSGKWRPKKTNLTLTYSKSYFVFLSQEMKPAFQSDFFFLSLFQPKKGRYPSPEPSCFLKLKPRTMYKPPRQLLFISISFNVTPTQLFTSPIIV